MCVCVCVCVLVCVCMCVCVCVCVQVEKERQKDAAEGLEIARHLEGFVRRKVSLHQHLRGCRDTSIFLCLCKHSWLSGDDVP